ncbi:hypothetical protein FHR24_002550 [Wenyingzhuangia heitensis]|uniref:DUF4296 domain-containing protein n=1 Tax=Wenyingzhuangia heitensis TaxID=1487859 RepID=A0ABX0UB70_9FLAO|nr:DUF4296 domain-containing protein [Wenyingzhuangia heitensis]NIJ46072.1 hypothetical protein [Wenyingzhuangia heitensis]
MKPYFFSLFFLFIVACDSNTIPKKPDNLIPQDKMATILADSYLARTAKNSVNKNGDRSINYHSLIYTKYNVDSLSFHNSLKYYTSDIKQHEEVLKQVENQLQQKLSLVEKELAKEVEKKQKEAKELNKKKDSIQ